MSNFQQRTFHFHMLIMVVAFVSTIITYFFGANAFADSQPLTLNAAIDIAKLQSPDRALLNANRESLLAQNRRSLAPAPPSFDLGLGDIAARPSEENSSLRTYQLSQSFGFPGKATSEAKSFELEAESVRYDLEAKDREITRLVQTAFYRFYLAKMKLQLIELKKLSFTKILTIAKRRMVKNTTTEVEYLSTQGALQSTENEKADLGLEEKNARVEFNILLGRAPGAELNVESPQIPSSPFKPDRSRLKAAFTQESPQLKASELLIKASESRVIQAKRSLLPDFKLMVGTNNYGGFAGNIELSFPLWYIWDENENIKSARQITLLQQAKAESLRRQLMQTFEERINKLEALSKKIANYKSELIPTSKRAFEVALKNYNYGKIDFSTFTTSTNTYVNSQLEYQVLLSDFLIGKAQLDEMTVGTLP